MYSFEKTIDGVTKYINNELFQGMNKGQEFAARVFIGRAIKNKEYIKQSLINNGFIRTFGIIDSDGMIDVDGLLEDIHQEIRRQEKISMEIPWFGKYTFSPSDVEILYKDITGKDMYLNENN